jgi:hypothetical protein
MKHAGIGEYLTTAAESKRFTKRTKELLLVAGGYHFCVQANLGTD